MGGGGGACDSQIKNKENQGSKALPRRRKKKRKPKVTEMLSSHSFPSETLTLWRVEKEDGKLPPHTGGGEDLPGLDFNDGGTLLSRTHAVHFLPWGSYLVLGKQAEDVEWGWGGGVIHETW